MSELDEDSWAVVSQRGSEATDLTHRQALELMRRLAEEKVYGLCLVTSDAARRLTHSTPAPQAQSIRPDRERRES